MFDEGLELLDEATALGLLVGVEIGRVGVTVGALPAIFPVNFRLIDGDIVFRTAPGTKLSVAAAESIVAFEVDAHDPATRTGWSVLVIGRARIVHDLGVTIRAIEAGLEPYADGGRRGHLVRIEPGLVTGRRIANDVGLG